MPTRARWLAVVFCLLYGFAKLNGSQFTILDSELSKPMGQVSGFWLTWYYFGYSPVYGTLIALLQVGGGVLLAFRRTALAAALMLVPVFVNIILIDLCFAIDPSATIVATIILGCLIAVIAPHANALKGVMLPATVRVRPLPRVATLIVLLISTWAFTWWIANYNNRLPTKIDGTWTVAPDSAPRSPWRRVFFEYNRAYMVIFRGPASDEMHHFEIDKEGTVRVWQTWLSKGDLIMQGHLRVDGKIELMRNGNTTPPLVFERDDTGGTSWRQYP
jgi:hypothetical protein